MRRYLPIKTLFFLFLVFVLLSPVKVVAEKKIKCKQVEDMNFSFYTNVNPPKPYLIIGKTYIIENNKKDFMCNLKRSILYYGGDGMLDYLYSSNALVDTHTNVGIVLFKAKGIIFRWTKQGETGVTKSNDNILVPVLENIK